MNSPSPPPAPTVGSQLQGSNTPLANVSWSQGPNGQWTSTTTPSQGVTNAVNAFNASSPTDINNAITQATGLGTKYMTPWFNQQDDQLAARLANEGFAPGSAGYTNALRDLSNNQTNWVGGNVSQFAPIAMQEYMAPLNAIATALNPSLINPNGGAVQNATNTTTAAQQYAYGQQLANKNAQMGGLFGLGAAGLGAIGKMGAGLGGSAGLSAALGGGGDSALLDLASLALV